MKAMVLGSGAWGTALALLLVRNGHEVRLWARDPDKVVQMAQTRRNPRLLGAALPPALRITASLAEAAEQELCVFAAPSYAVRDLAGLAAEHIRPGTLLVSAAKGVEPHSHLRMSQILRQVLGDGCPVAAVSGPSHAEEVAQQQPTGLIAAAEEQSVALQVQQAFMSPVFRVYTNPDLTGVELCGAAKNVIALGCGIIDGLDFGDNAKALLITRAMSEIARLCVAAGGLRETCAGLAGIGDLIVTCTSRHSRNRQAGFLIGQGRSVQEALREVGAVVEGYYAADSIRELGEGLGVSMPISAGIYQVLYAGQSPNEVMYSLMTRARRQEFSLLRWDNDID